jgi:hypothetical protein
MFSNIHVPTFGKSTPSSTTHESDSDNEHHRGAPLDVQTGRVDLLNEDVPFRLIPEDRRKRMVVAITGATGITIAIRLLQALRAIDVETHLIMSKWAGTTLKYETDYSVAEVRLESGATDHRSKRWPISPTPTATSPRRLPLAALSTMGCLSCLAV